MTRLMTEPRFADPDSVYARLVAAHRDLDEAASAALNARLVLILANHIGDEAVLAEAVALALAPMPTAGGGAGPVSGAA